MDIVLSDKDLFKLLLNLLSDSDKFYFLITCKNFYDNKYLITFDEQHHILKILKSSFFDCFTNLIFNEYIYFTNKEIFGEITRPLQMPNKIKKITLSETFNKSIKGCIPNTVTHLTFGNSFNKSIKGCIPNSVTHLTFGNSFNQSIKGCIPNSVIHLTFGCYFNQSILGNIPNSVSHLTFGRLFGKSIDGIPNSVTHLNIPGFCDMNNLPSSITNLKIYDILCDIDEFRKKITLNRTFNNLELIELDY